MFTVYTSLMDYSENKSTSASSDCGVRRYHDYVSLYIITQYVDIGLDIIQYHCSSYINIDHDLSTIKVFSSLVFLNYDSVSISCYQFILGYNRLSSRWYIDEYYQLQSWFFHSWYQIQTIVTCTPVGLPTPSASKILLDWHHQSRRRNSLNCIEVTVEITTNSSSSRRCLVQTPPQTGAGPVPPPLTAPEFPPSLPQSILNE